MYENKTFRGIMNPLYKLRSGMTSVMAGLYLLFSELNVISVVE